MVCETIPSGLLVVQVHSNRNVLETYTCRGNLWRSESMAVVGANVIEEATNKEQAIGDLCLVAFWALARLAELTYASECGPIQFDQSLLTSDVSFTTDPSLGRVATLTLRAAKTASPGNPKLQILNKQHHALCPVAAISHRLQETGGTQTSLFGYTDSGTRNHLTRWAVLTILREVFKRFGATER
ncbi:hypothetical protein PTTG_08387 [Puccinia triticina 1-1 BBBD Race 1]|uniref:Uncharacterized protein n=1 Tax=Puccinia triticina (isolate 1-1 / race 1 (BBBD)) TaxID=630390 RepID=A0A0C4F5I7_PUCT1|nr:hypothetical protein PTTG_08387 [Puccinia triticina 1-1 BBBD Race 1]